MSRKLSKREQQAAEGMGTYAGFGESVLGFNFYPGQREILQALQPNGAFVSGRLCNGGGKTTRIILTAILAHLTLARGKVITTSGSFRQIKDQLDPALKAYQSRFPAFRFLDCRIATSNPNCFWDGFSTSDAGKFEGHHGSEQCPLLLIVDEAKTVKDCIFEAIERCRPPRLWCRVLVLSSPGYAQGEFYRLHSSRMDTLTHPPVKITAAECAHIAPAEIEAIRSKWGPLHPLVRSMLDAEFMPFVEGAIVQLSELDALLADPPPYRPGERKLFIDAAWSEAGEGDETVLASRNGNRIALESCFREKGLHATAGRLIHEFVRLGLAPSEAWIIEGDNGGTGKLIIDQLWKMGWKVSRANLGEKPRYNDRYQNLAAEMWVEGAMAIARREFILPDDGDLYGQMLNRRIVPNNRGLLAIESKLAMKDPNREGGSVTSSPDRADAVFGVMAPLPIGRSINVMGGQDRNQLPTNKDVWPTEHPREQESVQSEVIPGCWFG